MLSRRNIRIKLMQTLYADTFIESKTSFSRLKKDLLYQMQQSEMLFFYHIAFLYEICKYSVKDGEKRKVKHLPTAIDKVFKPKLFDNSLVQSIRKDEALMAEFKFHKMSTFIDEALVRTCYNEFSKTADYKDFLRDEESSQEEYIELLLKIFKLFMKNELFKESLEDNFYFWKNDKSLIVGVIKKYIKNLPSQGNHHKKLMPGKDIVDEFALLLLQSTHDNSTENKDRIEKSLQNWDMDRVAKLDLILLQMALSEMLTFPTIPAKVTINEYVDISKRYSTDKSKEFVNGILDRLMKKFQEDGTLMKEGRGLIEE